VSGNDTQQQREVAVAIKNAREMALLPYTRRVATQRGPKGERGDGERRGGRDAERIDAAESPVSELEGTALEGTALEATDGDPEATEAVADEAEER
jgi:small subunit ribosomal protein S18